MKAYYQLAKPGIIYGNSITAAAGFFLAAKGDIHWGLLIAMLIGLGLVIGAACVFNNYFDIDIDSKMGRTKDRALVTGSIAKKNALIYGAVLLLIGILVLYFYTNPLTLLIALIGVFFYVAVYTPLKRRTNYGALIGSISGAVPPVVGFCAVTNSLAGSAGIEALILFFILVFWQMPHFYAIAIYRRKDYDTASIPVLPISKGIRTAKIDMLFYLIAFIIATTLLTVFGFTGYGYLIIVLLLGLIWLCLGIRGFRTKIDDTRWARNMFIFSLIVIVVLSITLSLTAVLP